ncbi:MAG: hypothetical protein Q9207_003516 [Kuettlingeria erythrocarpa]
MRHIHCPPPFQCHFRSTSKRIKRIKRTLILRHGPKAYAAAVHSHDAATPPATVNPTGGESPPSLHRSNAIRRAVAASRSRSPSPQLFTPTGFRVRNRTPSPTRPTSIVPTLMIHNTPSTNQTSLSRSTAPTSPSATTFISSVHHYGHERPTTLYLVNGVAIDSEPPGSPPLELRCCEALRAPGEEGHRVVDVVQARQSGRLTVVNGCGRASLDTVESRRGGEGVIQTIVPPPPPLPSAPQREQQQDHQGQPATVQLAPRPGTPTYRAFLEDRRNQEGNQAQQQQQQQQRRTTTSPSPPPHPPLPDPPTRRRPLPLLPASPSPSASSPTNRSSPAPILIRRKPVPLSPVLPRTRADAAAAAAASPRFSNSPQHRVYYQRRKKPMARPPIPNFVTEGELLAEVEGVRRLLDARDEVGGRKGGDGVGLIEREEIVEEWDWFWVDGDDGAGALRYRKGGLPAMHADL